MTPERIFHAAIATNLIAVAMIAVSWFSQKWGRLVFGLLFFWAAGVNWWLAQTTPEVYLKFADSAVLPLYREFILGFFARHTREIVTLIAAGQAFVGVLVFLPGVWLRIGLSSAIFFLIAIAPFGIGSAFPSSLLMAGAALVLMRKSERPVVRKRPSVR